MNDHHTGPDGPWARTMRNFTQAMANAGAAEPDTGTDTGIRMPRHLMPNLIYWPRIEGFQVFLSEDGVHLKAERDTTVEPCDLERLLEAIYAARAAHEAGVAPTPTPPDPSSFERWDYESRARYAARIATNAIKESYGVKDDEVPF